MRTAETPTGPWITLDGRRVLLLCSNDYLGLANHPAVRAAAADAAQRWGAGAGASRLVSGTLALHRRLERSLAEFEQADSVALFGSGYLANIGVLTALAGRGSFVFSDERNHASIIDACRLSRAEVFVYDHGDVDHLAWALARTSGAEATIVTDSVFSMDGDVAPLQAIVELARRHGARVVVDEAHGTGCLGPGGRGAVHAAGVQGEVDIVIGTLGKALGSYGAYAAGDRDIVELLVNTARPFVFSTAPAPPAVAAAQAALEVLVAEPERVSALQANAAVLHRALGRSGPVSHIVPLVIGDATASVERCERALAAGVFAQAIRPPTVPPGTSRLRLAVMATHDAEDLEWAAEVIQSARVQP